MRIKFIGRGLIYEKCYDYFKYKKLHNVSLISSFEEVFKENFDLLVCLSHSYKFPGSVIEWPKYGTINLHTSLLPKYRGRHPVSWAIEKGEKEFGITVHWMAKEIDKGDIILQDSIVVDNTKDYVIITNKLLRKGIPMLATAIEQIRYGCTYRRKQIEELASYYPVYKEVK